MKLSKEQREELANKLNYPYGTVKLICDGTRVTLQVQRAGKGVTYRIMTYVEDEFKGVWISSKEALPEQKFLRKSVRPIASPAKRKEMEKILGKRRVKNDPYWSGSLTFYLPDWGTGQAAINHLCKVCESVQIATEDQETAAEIAPPRPAWWELGEHIGVA